MLSSVGRPSRPRSHHLVSAVGGPCSPRPTGSISCFLVCSILAGKERSLTVRQIELRSLPCSAGRRRHPLARRLGPNENRAHRTDRGTGESDASRLDPLKVAGLALRGGSSSDLTNTHILHFDRPPPSFARWSHDYALLQMTRAFRPLRAFARWSE
jgi:hypothetical protein